MCELKATYFTCALSDIFTSNCGEMGQHPPGYPSSLKLIIFTSMFLRKSAAGDDEYKKSTHTKKDKLRWTNRIKSSAHDFLTIERKNTMDRSPWKGLN